MKQVHLKHGKEDSLLRFHPWIFSGAIHHMDGGIEEGDAVRVITERGDCIAVGHYQQGSIAVRVLTFRDVAIDKAFWESRLASSLAMRQAIGLAGREDTNAFRLVHGEGDHLPGLIIDVYGKTAVMQAHSIGMHRARVEIAESLMKVMEGQLENVYYKSETTLPYMDLENGFLYGGNDENTALENGLQFYVDWMKGQKTGFFVDQRDNRSLLEHYTNYSEILKETILELKHRKQLPFYSRRRENAGIHKDVI